MRIIVRSNRLTHVQSLEQLFQIMLRSGYVIRKTNALAAQNFGFAYVIRIGRRWYKAQRVLPGCLCANGIGNNFPFRRQPGDTRTSLPVIEIIVEREQESDYSRQKKNDKLDLRFVQLHVLGAHCVDKRNSRPGRLTGSRWSMFGGHYRLMYLPRFLFRENDSHIRDHIAVRRSVYTAGIFIVQQRYITI